MENFVFESKGIILFDIFVFDHRLFFFILVPILNEYLEFVHCKIYVKIEQEERIKFTVFGNNIGTQYSCAFSRIKNTLQSERGKFQR